MLQRMQFIESYARNQRESRILHPWAWDIPKTHSAASLGAGVGAEVGLYPHP